MIGRDLLGIFEVGVFLMHQSFGARIWVNLGWVLKPFSLLVSVGLWDYLLTSWVFNCLQGDWQRNMRHCSKRKNCGPCIEHPCCLCGPHQPFCHSLKCFVSYAKSQPKNKMLWAIPSAHPLPPKLPPPGTREPHLNCLQTADIWGSAPVRGCICIWPMKSLYKPLQLELPLASFRQRVCRAKASTVPSTNCKLLCGISAHGAWSPQWTQSLGGKGFNSWVVLYFVMHEKSSLAGTS